MSVSCHSLSGTKIRAVGARWLSRYLDRNTTLKILKYGWAARLISPPVSPRVPSLTCVKRPYLNAARSLDGSRIGDDGIDDLAGVVASMSLEKLQ